jgi:putative membrane protein
MDALELKYILASAVYSFIGVIILMVAFWLVDRFTPENTWKEIVQNKNVALAIVVAAFIIAIGMIISSAIHS